MKRYLLLMLITGFGTSAFAQELPWDVNGRGLSFIPDYTFKGSALTGWSGIGTNKWKAANGEIQVNLNGGNAVLASTRSFQDVGVNLLVKAAPGTEAGVLVRLQKSAEGYKGILVALTDSDAVSYRITLAADGKELSRERLRPAGNIIRVAPPAPAGGNEQQQRRGNGSRGSRPAGPAGLLARPSTAIIPGDWNQMEIIIDFNIIRKFINDGGDGTGGATEDTDGNFGPIALWAKGSGEIAFKYIHYKDMAVRFTPKEATSPRFSAQRISDMFYSFTVAAADFNKDGKMDVAAGPYIYYGPDFTNYREVFFAQTYNPSREFADANCMYAFDFNNDGWQDIFIGAAGPPRIYLNPKGESRRWDKYEVVKGGVSEVTVFNDLNGDGKPELIYGQNGAMWYARFNPADALKPWKTVQISEAGYYMPHGIGTGDINGDGRVDIVNPHGWWEQPAKGQDEAKWTFHSEAFARYGHRSVGAGGSVMAVYDVNGDGLNDIVTSLNAHGFGIGWFEQKRDAGGKISFVKHLIADDYSVENPGGVAISEIHGTNFADIDGDEIPDFIVGKRYWSHLDSYFDPDPYGPPVVYVYKTVRDKKAPGGARFVPELVHNRSGAGSDITVADLDKNGTVDIITSTDRGTYIFWNRGTGKK
ncbi:MAG: VCBS repeat-containing protein [Sphingobacteriaceae bacterium]|nr:MAG: VCBS repeat-containing protein [Sphingobacteriaceae bacterium]